MEVLLIGKGSEEHRTLLLHDDGDSICYIANAYTILQDPTSRPTLPYSPPVEVKEFMRHGLRSSCHRIVQVIVDEL